MPAFTVARNTRLVDADDRVVGADLPDHQPRPAGLQRALQPFERLGGEFAADPCVLHVEVGARPLFELRLEPGRIGVRGRSRPDALGRRRADRQNVERQADPHLRECERRRRWPRTLRFRSGTTPLRRARPPRANRTADKRPPDAQRRWLRGGTCGDVAELFCTRSSGRRRTGRRWTQPCTRVRRTVQPLQTRVVKRPPARPGRRRSRTNRRRKPSRLLRPRL